MRKRPPESCRYAQELRVNVLGEALDEGHVSRIYFLVQSGRNGVRDIQKPVYFSQPLFRKIDNILLKKEDEKLIGIEVVVVHFYVIVVVAHLDDSKRGPRLLFQSV